ncbi:F-box only protein 39-like [Ornithodoros turicata]|uniref:F-box only protein 39-like n=1 Tax=Ornithodoros turicata TaxID=34597 RepID=UPI003139D068
MNEDAEDTELPDTAEEFYSNDAVTFCPRVHICKGLEEEDEDQGPWACLPDILLEDIYAMVPIDDRYSMSQVCRNWYRVFFSPRVWMTFVLNDRALTRRKFNYYMGYQFHLDHYRAHMCVHKIGRFIRRLVVPPMANFFNLYEFMVIMAYFGEASGSAHNPLAHLRSFEFTFGCMSSDGRQGQDNVFGTGGKLLESLKRLMRCFIGLRHLSLKDLLLDHREAKYLLDDTVENTMVTLKTLRLINCTKEPYPLLHVGVFLNLNDLYLSPQHLDDDVVSLLGSTRLRNLHLVQTTHTDIGIRVSSRTWRECKKSNPRLRVHLAVEGRIRKELVWQDCAPVHSIVYRTPYNQVCPESALMASTIYASTLACYAFLGLPKFHMAKRFVDRSDSALVLLCRSCPRLETLIIRERVSTATVLLLAYYGHNLRQFVVRRNAIMKKCDWPQNIDWTDDFFVWLKMTSQSYDLVYKEVSRMMGVQWEPLTDKQFKAFELRADYYKARDHDDYGD